VNAFLVFEGIDGSGKTTQVGTLYQALASRGLNPLQTREIGGTPLGDEIARWLKTVPHRSRMAELFLLAAARAQHVEEVIRPALDSGRIVVCDRFTGSTLAYQGYGRGIDLETVRRVNDLATKGLEPTLTVLMDLNIQAARDRKPSHSRDVFEREDNAFLQRVRDGYLALAREAPDQWLVVDSTLPIEKAAQIIWERAQELVG
jgi:dTMP kinase